VPLAGEQQSAGRQPALQGPQRDGPEVLHILGALAEVYRSATASAILRRAALAEYAIVAQDLKTIPIEQEIALAPRHRLQHGRIFNTFR
jgi:hypothetical protein